MLLPLWRGIVYGPVLSRRLGASLGINLAPAGRKHCSLDCLYCQYGWTEESPAQFDEADLPPPDAVAGAVRAALQKLHEPPRFITFSGAGEATLHPRFAEIVDEIVRVRDDLAPTARTAILSNSTQVADPGVRAALSKLDLRIMKLDAGTEAMFRSYNRPLAPVTLDEITAGLAALPGVTLQSLFCAGALGNIAPAEIAAWLQRVVAIAPRAVQVYTLDRDAPSDAIEPASPAQLEAIREALATRGVVAEVFR